MSTDLLLPWAEWYATEGWPVVPLHTPTKFGPKKGDRRAECSCRKDRCESQGKHPRTPNGLTGATTNLDQIRAWWEQWPDANIGLVTGIAFDVLDLDGVEALDQLDQGAPDGAGELVGPMVATGRAGGVHIYLQPTGIGNKAGGKRGIPTGIDFRSTGGYVVAPPSVHHLGHAYRWGVELGPETPLQTPPAWLTAMLTGDVPQGPQPAATASHGQLNPGGDRYAVAALERICGRMVTSPEGTRNHMLNECAYGLGRVLARGGIDHGSAVATLVEAARRSGLTDTEIEATIKSGLEAGLKKGPTGRAVRR